MSARTRAEGGARGPLPARTVRTAIDSKSAAASRGASAEEEAGEAHVSSGDEAGGKARAAGAAAVAVLRAGELELRKHDASFFARSSWKHRHVTLTAEALFVRDGDSVREVALLAQATAEMLGMDAHGKRFCFRVRCRDWVKRGRERRGRRSFIFGSRDARVAASWMSAVAAALAALRGPAPMIVGGGGGSGGGGGAIPAFDLAEQRRQFHALYEAGPERPPGLPLSQLRRELEQLYEPMASGFSDCLTEEDKHEAARTGSSLLYGEVLPEGVLRALDSEHLDARNATVVFDLGAGVGKFALQVLLQYTNVRRVVGVELAFTRYQISRVAAWRLCKEARARRHVVGADADADPLPRLSFQDLLLDSPLADEAARTPLVRLVARAPDTPGGPEAIASTAASSSSSSPSSPSSPSSSPSSSPLPPPPPPAAAPPVAAAPAPSVEAAPTQRDGADEKAASDAASEAAGAGEGGARPEQAGGEAGAAALRSLELRRGNLFDAWDVGDADIVVMETMIPDAAFERLALFLQRLRKGCRVLSFNNLRSVEFQAAVARAGCGFPLEQLAVNVPTSDRFLTTWNRRKGHHFYLWRKVD